MAAPARRAVPGVRRPRRAALQAARIIQARLQAVYIVGVLAYTPVCRELCAVRRVALPGRTCVVCIAAAFHVVPASSTK